jgi:ankyrin repeat protein
MRPVRIWVLGVLGGLRIRRLNFLPRQNRNEPRGCADNLLVLICATTKGLCVHFIFSRVFLFALFVFSVGINSCVSPVYASTAAQLNDSKDLFALIANKKMKKKDLNRFLQVHSSEQDFFLAQVNDQKENIFMAAIHAQRNDLFQMLYVEFGEPDLNDCKGCQWPNTTFGYALMYGNWKLISTLKNFGLVDVTEASGDQKDSELTVASLANSPEVLQKLIEKGGDVNQANAYGVTPLMRAANNSADTVTVLLNNGANINAQDAAELTPLLYATNSTSIRSLEILKALLAAHPIVELHADRMDTAFTAAATYLPDVSKTQVSVPYLQALVEAGVVTEARGYTGRTALVNAAGASSVDVIDYLLGKGISIDAEDDSGSTALMEAAHFNSNLGVTSHLIEKDADINHQDHEGATALMWAAFANPTEDVALALLKAHADANIVDRSGSNALFWALGTQNIKIIKAIVQAGVNLSHKNSQGENVLEIAKKTNLSKTIIELVTDKKEPKKTKKYKRS